MKEVILIKDGELSLKGLNRSVFEDKMISTIKRRIKRYGDFSVTKSQSTVYIEPAGDTFDFEGALRFFDWQVAMETERLSVEA